MGRGRKPLGPCAMRSQERNQQRKESIARKEEDEREDAAARARQYRKRKAEARPGA
jgi:hypothetical protein